MPSASPRNPAPAVGRVLLRLAQHAVRLAAARRAPLGSLVLFGTTAGLVAANALAWQPRAHPKPMLVTRPDVAVALAAPPALVHEVQARLAALGFYREAVDGEPGPATEAAIRAFQSAAGLEADGLSSPILLARLRRAGGNPVPRAEPRPAAILANVSATEATGAIAAPAGGGEELVRRIQSGLKAARVADLEADGVLGERTRGAIRTFQALDGLDVTGDPSEQLLERLLRLAGGP